MVNAAFVGVIVALLVLLGGAAAWTYYEANLRPVANVGGVEIRPDMVRARQALLHLRLDREERRLVDAVTAGDITSAAAGQRGQEIASRRQQVGVLAEGGLIDIIFQSQLAAEMGIVPSDEEIDQRQQRDLAGAERRHVQVIAIEPEVSEGAVFPTFRQQSVARERAEEALAALEAGRPWEEVAAEYSTDENAQSAGDLGFIGPVHTLDQFTIDALFQTPVGETTNLIRGDDSTYRIGRVVEVQAAGEDFTYADAVRSRVSEERHRQFIAWELASERLSRQVTDEALAATPEQLRLAHIRIENVQPGEEPGEDDEDQIHYSEILYSPNDDPITAPDLDENDPAWEPAREEAEAAVAELLAIEDTAQRLERFREIAREHSDNDITAPDGGDAGAVSRDIPPSEVGDALFDTAHDEDTLIGPVRAENGYYLLWFHERRDPPAIRLQQLVDALGQPGADFAALVGLYSDDEQSREEGGDIGWWTREMLNEIQDELGDTLYGLQAGGTSEPIAIGENTHLFHVVRHEARAIDADQARAIRLNAFSSWYSERKSEAERQGIIVRPGQPPEDDEDLEPGLDFGDEFGDDFGIDFGEEELP